MECVCVFCFSVSIRRRKKKIKYKKRYTWLTAVFVHEDRMELYGRLFDDCLALDQTQFIAARIVNVYRRAQV